MFSGRFERQLFYLRRRQHSVYFRVAWYPSCLPPLNYYDYSTLCKKGGYLKQHNSRNLTRESVPAGVLAVPCRYVHVPVSVVSLVNYENTVRLLRVALGRLGGGLEARKI
ncbi:MAG: hypothetical protein ACYCZF_06805 [Anaerolineae bacterium]